MVINVMKLLGEALLSSRWSSDLGHAKCEQRRVLALRRLAKCEFIDKDGKFVREGGK